MTATDVSCRFLTQLENAASQYAVYGDPQTLIDMIDQVQKESFTEGYEHAIEVLQNNMDITIKGGNHYE